MTIERIIGRVSAPAKQTVVISFPTPAEKKTVKWTPVKGEGNALVSGKWTIKEKAGKTTMKLSIKGAMELPLPSLVKFVVAPVVKHQFEGLVDEYVVNLTKTLESGKKPKAKAAKKK